MRKLAILPHFRKPKWFSLEAFRLQPDGSWDPPWQHQNEHDRAVAFTGAENLATDFQDATDSYGQAVHKWLAKHAAIAEGRRVEARRQHCLRMIAEIKSKNNGISKWEWENLSEFPELANEHGLVLSPVVWYGYRIHKRGSKVAVGCWDSWTKKLAILATFHDIDQARSFVRHLEKWRLQVECNLNYELLGYQAHLYLPVYERIVSIAQIHGAISTITVKGLRTP